MAIEVFNRFENKYIISQTVFESLQTELAQYMEADAYNQNQQLYTISNLYFDTRDNNLIRHSLSKPKYKEKLRLRAYGVPGEDSKVFFEIKKKVCGLVNKRRTTLKLQEAYGFAATGSQPELMPYMNRQVMNEIAYILKIYDLEPRLYLAYDRLAMFSRDSRDLRITFDTHIRTRRTDLRLEAGDHGESLLEPGEWLMEIKAEKTFPLWLTQLLAKHRIFSVSFSKYGTEYKNYVASGLQMKGAYPSCLTQSSQQPQLVPQYL